MVSELSPATKASSLKCVHSDWWFLKLSCLVHIRLLPQMLSSLWPIRLFSFPSHTYHHPPLKPASLREIQILALPFLTQHSKALLHVSPLGFQHPCWQPTQLFSQMLPLLNLTIKRNIHLRSLPNAALSNSSLLTFSLTFSVACLLPDVPLGSFSAS